MKLLTKQIRKQLPAIYSQEKNPDPLCVVKFFDPSGRGTWYGTEFDGTDRFFGFVVSPLGSDCDELGYFSLSELGSIRGRFGLGIERDLYWTPAPLSEVKAAAAA